MTVIAQVFPEWADHLGTELGAVWPVFLAAGIVIAAASKWGRKAMQKVVREEVGSITGPLHHERQVAETALTEQLNVIKSEVKTNGGSSLRDAVDRIGVDVRSLSSSFSIITARVLALQSNADLALYETDTEGQLKHVNAAFCELYGISYADVMAGKWSTLLDTDDLARINMSGIASIENRQPWFDHWTIHRLDGRDIPVVGHGYPIIESDGTWHGYAGSVTIRRSMFNRRSTDTPATE